MSNTLRHLTGNMIRVAAVPIITLLGVTACSDDSSSEDCVVITSASPTVSEAMFAAALQLPGNQSPQTIYDLATRIGSGATNEMVVMCTVDENTIAAEIRHDGTMRAIYAKANSGSDVIPPDQNLAASLILGALEEEVE